MTDLFAVIFERFRWYRRLAGGEWFYVSAGVMLPGGPFEYWVRRPPVHRGVGRAHIVVHEKYASGRLVFLRDRRFETTRT